MAGEQAPWFVVERSAALAALLLTSQDHVEIASRREQDDGVDLFVGLDGRASPPTRQFVVQVKGTASANPADWMQNVKPLFVGEHYPFLPTCVVVVDVRDNKARYAWIAEPVAESDRTRLRVHQVPVFHELDDAAVAGLVDRVRAYYDVMPKQLLPAG